LPAGLRSPGDLSLLLGIWATGGSSARALPRRGVALDRGRGADLMQANPEWPASAALDAVAVIRPRVWPKPVDPRIRRRAIGPQRRDRGRGRCDRLSVPVRISRSRDPS